jgi:hypothetical protein
MFYGEVGSFGLGAVSYRGMTSVRNLGVAILEGLTQYESIVASCSFTSKLLNSSAPHGEKGR